MQYKTIKKLRVQLLKEGCELVQNLVVEKITLTKLDSFTTRIILMLDKPIKQMVINSSGERVEEMRNWIVTYDFSLRKYLSCNSNTAFMKDIIINSPKLLHLILEGAEIEILLEYVYEGQEYEDPFSSKAKVVLLSHDDIKTYIVDIRLTQFAFKIIDKFESLIWDAMMVNCYNKRIDLNDKEIDAIIYNDYNSNMFKNPFIDK